MRDWGKRTHAEMLPEIKADRLAWEAEHLPRLRARDRLQAEKRAKVSDVIARGLVAVDASAAERAAVFELTGFGA